MLLEYRLELLNIVVQDLFTVLIRRFRVRINNLGVLARIKTVRMGIDLCKVIRQVCIKGVSFLQLFIWVLAFASKFRVRRVKVFLEKAMFRVQCGKHI